MYRAPSWSLAQLHILIFAGKTVGELLLDILVQFKGLLGIAGLLVKDVKSQFRDWHVI